MGSAAGIVTDDELALVVALIYELAGSEAVDGLLTRAEAGHVSTLKRLHRLGARESTVKAVCL